MMGMVELGYISVTHLPIPGPDTDDGHGGVGYTTVTNLPIPCVKTCQYLSLMYLSLYVLKFKLINVNL